MRLDFEQRRELYETGNEGTPTIEYKHHIKHTVWFRKPIGNIEEMVEGTDFTHDPEIEENIIVYGRYEQLWSEFGAYRRYTFRGRVSKSFTNMGKSSDMSKIPQELTDLLKQLPEHVRKVIDDKF